MTSPSVMPPATFRQGLRLLQMTQEALAASLGVNPRTVRKWALGERPVPNYVGRHMALLLKVERLERELEIRKRIIQGQEGRVSSPTSSEEEPAPAA